MDGESHHREDPDHHPRKDRNPTPEVDAEELDLGPAWEDSPEWRLEARRAPESASRDGDPRPVPRPQRDPETPAIPKPRRAAHKSLDSAIAQPDALQTRVPKTDPSLEDAAAELAGTLAKILTSQFDGASSLGSASARTAPAAPGRDKASEQPVSNPDEPSKPAAKTGAFVSLDEVLTRMEESKQDEWAVAGANADAKPRNVYSGLSYAVREIPFARALVDASGQWKPGSLLRLLVLATAAVAVAAAVFAVSSFLKSERNASEAHKLAATVAPPEIVQRETVKSVVTSYFEAADWEERLRWVRSPELVQAKMQDWYARHPDPGPQKIRRLGRIANATYGDTRCVVVGVVLEGSARQRAVILEWPHGQYYRIDWETLSGYQARTPAELFHSADPAESELRCVLTRSDYYNGPFTDESQWRCFALDYPANDAGFFGYVARGSAVEEAIEEAFKKRVQLGSLIRVKTSPEASRFRQLEILELLESTWIPQYGKRRDS